MTPTYIRFLGQEGQPLKRTVKIKPLNGHTFSIKDVKTKEGKHLAFDWKPEKGDASKYGYRLEVENTMKTSGYYRDLITITTDSKVKPTLHIPVSTRIIGKPGKSQSKPQ